MMSRHSNYLRPTPSRQLIVGRWVGGFVVAGAAVWGVWTLAGHHSKASAPSASGPSATTSGFPHYSARLVPGQSVQAQMRHLDSRYVAWADRQIAAQVPAIPASGTDAGTLTPSIANAPSTLKTWPGPQVPTSLQKIKIPATIPANGSVLGLTPSFVQNLLPSSAHGTPGLSANQVLGAFREAAQFDMAYWSNNPIQGVQLMDPYAWQGQAVPTYLANLDRTPLTQLFSASARQGGRLARRQVVYDQWVTVSSTSNVDTQCPPATHPSGRVRVACLDITHLTVHTIESRLVHGHLTIVLFQHVMAHTALTLVAASHGRPHWWVLGLNGIGSATKEATY